jgi:ABC-type nitrate/sulfonate/bicarbonate transport system substrate-binding protein
MTRNRGRCGLLVLLLLAALLTGLQAPRGAAAADGVTITTFSGPFAHFAAIFVADAKGFFKARGVNVTVRLFDSGGAASAAFRGGRADVLSGCDFPTISLLQVEDAIVLAPIEHDANSILMSAPKSVGGLKDLHGKKIGVPLRTSAEFFTARALASVGMTTKDVQLVNLGPADLLPAVVRGDVDVAAWWEPFGWKAEEASGGKVQPLVRGKGFYTLYCPISARRKFVEAHPGETVKFLKALHDATKWLTDTPSEERARVIAEYTKSDLPTTKKLADLLTYDMTETPEYRASMEAMQDFMQKSGLIKKSVDWSKVLGTKYLREADPSLVK